ISLCTADTLDLHSFPTRRSSDLILRLSGVQTLLDRRALRQLLVRSRVKPRMLDRRGGVSAEGHRYLCVRFGVEAGFVLVERDHRSEEHTSELQSLRHLVCRLLLE